LDGEKMSEMADNRRKNILDLADKGFECLREGDYDAALKIAEELEKQRYTAAFDIGAQAYAAQGNLKKAIETLERGVSTEPKCWLNWELLGNYRSDEGDCDKAATAYEQALACPNVVEDSIRLNQAILAGRRGDHAGALALLEMIRDSNLILPVAAAKVQALRGAGKISEALTLADECLNKDWKLEAAPNCLARIAAVQGRMRLEKRIPSRMYVERRWSQ
jgi:tetratricopeptide (TPR) repeat protein